MIPEKRLNYFKKLRKEFSKDELIKYINAFIKDFIKNSVYSDQLKSDVALIIEKSNEDEFEVLWILYVELFLKLENLMIDDISRIIKRVIQKDDNQRYNQISSYLKIQDYNNVEKLINQYLMENKISLSSEEEKILEEFRYQFVGNL